jgi:hypothetical protein
MMSMLCNCCVCELLILARTWFAFGLPSKTGCDREDREKVGRRGREKGAGDAEISEGGARAGPTRQWRWWQNCLRPELAAEVARPRERGS